MFWSLSSIAAASTAIITVVVASYSSWDDSATAGGTWAVVLSCSCPVSSILAREGLSKFLRTTNA